MINLGVDQSQRGSAGSCINTRGHESVPVPAAGPFSTARCLPSPWSWFPEAGGELLLPRREEEEEEEEEENRCANAGGCTGAAAEQEEEEEEEEVKEARSR